MPLKTLDEVVLLKYDQVLERGNRLACALPCALSGECLERYDNQASIQMHQVPSTLHNKAMITR